MSKVRLSMQEIEAVRVACLRLMSTRSLTAEDLAHRMPRVRVDTLRKFLTGRRPSQRVAVELVRRFPLGLAYSPPSISPSPAVATATAAATVSASRCE